MDDRFEDPHVFEGFDFRVDDHRLEGVAFEELFNRHESVFGISFPLDPDLLFPFGEDVGEVGLDDHQGLLLFVGEYDGAGVVFDALLDIVGRVWGFIPPDRGVFLVEVVLFGVVVDGVEHPQSFVLEVFPPLGQGWALVNFLTVRHGGLL